MLAGFIVGLLIGVPIGLLITAILVVSRDFVEGQRLF